MAEAPRQKEDTSQNPAAAATTAVAVAAVAADPRLATPAKPQNQLQKVGNRSYPMTSIGDVGNPLTSKEVLQGPRSSMQRMQHQRTLREGMHEEVCTPGKHTE